MSFPFDPRRGPIEVLAQLSGPSRAVDLRLILETGATNSMVREDFVIAAGYDPAHSTDRVKVAMGNGVAMIPRIVVNRFTALGAHRIGFPILAHALPPVAKIDGLLGLDFLRGHVLNLDFQSGVISFL